MTVTETQQLATGTTNGHAFDPTASIDEHGPVPVTDKAPTASELAQASELPVLSEDGTSQPFGTLIPADGKVLVIFVRHFLCGMCQEYLRTLCSEITTSSVSALTPKTFLVIVGCGQADMIPMYREATTCEFPIYADPTRRLYDVLDMTRTLTLGKKPEYVKTSFLGVLGSSLIQGLKQGTNASRAGDVRQVGGEFLIERKASKEGVEGSTQPQVTWCHRMTSTRDHSEMPLLKSVLGLE